MIKNFEEKHKVKLDYLNEGIQLVSPNPEALQFAGKEIEKTLSQCTQVSISYKDIPPNDPNELKEWILKMTGNDFKNFTIQINMKSCEITLFGKPNEVSKLNKNLKEKLKISRFLQSIVNSGRVVYEKTN